MFYCYTPPKTWSKKSNSLLSRTKNVAVDEMNTFLVAVDCCSIHLLFFIRPSSLAVYYLIFHCFDLCCWSGHTFVGGAVFFSGFEGDICRDICCWLLLVERRLIFQHPLCGDIALLLLKRLIEAFFWSFVLQPVVKPVQCFVCKSIHWTRYSTFKGRGVPFVIIVFPRSEAISTVSILR